MDDIPNQGPSAPETTMPRLPQATSQGLDPKNEWHQYYTAREDAFDALKEATRLFRQAQGALDKAIETKSHNYQVSGLPDDLRTNLETRWTLEASKGVRS